MQIQRTANACGAVSIAGQNLSVGGQHAGRRVTIQLNDGMAHVIVDGVLTRTTTLALNLAQRRPHRGRAARRRRRPARTRRRVSSQGDTQVIGQRVPVGQRHAGRLVAIEIGETTLAVYDKRGAVLINQIRVPAPNHWTASRPTVATATEQPARDRHPSTEAKPSRII